eukprot:3294721-Pyramimonas_sp.AAC.1
MAQECLGAPLNLRHQTTPSSLWSFRPGLGSRVGDVSTGMAAGSTIAEDGVAGLIQARTSENAPGGGGPDELAAGQEEEEEEEDQCSPKSHQRCWTKPSLQAPSS